MLLLVDNYQHTFANRSHVKYEFTNAKKLVKKLARIEASSICRQQFVNVFADCFWAVHTHQLEFANTSLPTLVCRVKAALEVLKYYIKHERQCFIGISKHREESWKYDAQRSIFLTKFEVFG